MFYQFIFKQDTPISSSCDVLNIGTEKTSTLGGKNNTKLIVQTTTGLYFEPEIEISFELNYVAVLDADLDLNNELAVLDAILNTSFAPDFIPYYKYLKEFGSDKANDLNTILDFEVNMICSEDPNSVNALDSEDIDLVLVDDNMYSFTMNKNQIVHKLLPNLELFLLGMTHDQNHEIKTLADVTNHSRREQITEVQKSIADALRVSAAQKVMEKLKNKEELKLA